MSTANTRAFMLVMKRHMIRLLQADLRALPGGTDVWLRQIAAGSPSIGGRSGYSLGALE